MQDLTGRRFGYWTVIEELGGDYVEAHCDCGVVKRTRKQYITNGQSRSCGCRRHEDRAPAPIQVGDHFGRLTVVQRLGTDGFHKDALVRCACGARKVVREGNLRDGGTTSCGCLQKEQLSDRTTTHGDTKYKARTALYRAWESMRRRCREAGRYPSYRRNGITVYPVWEQSYETFRDYVHKHLGERPEGHSLDRIDNSKGYFPGNLRWASSKTQARNRSVTRRLPKPARAKPQHASGNTLLTVNGRAQCVAAWAEEVGISTAVIRRRLSRGWSAEQAVAPLKREHKLSITINGETLSARQWAVRSGLSQPTITRRIIAGWAPYDAVFTPANKKKP